MKYFFLLIWFFYVSALAENIFPIPKDYCEVENIPENKDWLQEEKKNLRYHKSELLIRAFVACKEVAALKDPKYLPLHSGQYTLTRGMENTIISKENWEKISTELISSSPKPLEAIEITKRFSEKFRKTGDAFIFAEKDELIYLTKSILISFVLFGEESNGKKSIGTELIASTLINGRSVKLRIMDVEQTAEIFLPKLERIIKFLSALEAGGIK